MRHLLIFLGVAQLALLGGCNMEQPTKAGDTIIQQVVGGNDNTYHKFEKTYKISVTRQTGETWEVKIIDGGKIKTITGEARKIITYKVGSNDAFPSIDLEAKKTNALGQIMGVGYKIQFREYTEVRNDGVRVKLEDDLHPPVQGGSELTGNEETYNNI